MQIPEYQKAVGKLRNYRSQLDAFSPPEKIRCELPMGRPATAPSDEAIAHHRQITSYVRAKEVFGTSSIFGLAGAIPISWFFTPTVGVVVGLFGLASAFMFATLKRPKDAHWLDKHVTLATRLANKISDIQNAIELTAIDTKRQEICAVFERASEKLRDIEAAIQPHIARRADNQLRTYLARTLLAEVAVPGINQRDKTILSEAGVITAHDAENFDLTKIKGIGAVKQSQIAVWLTALKLHHVYNDVATPEEVAHVTQSIEQQFDGFAQIASEIEGNIAELHQVGIEIANPPTSSDPEVQAISRSLQQLQHDLSYLGIERPMFELPPPRTISCAPVAPRLTTQTS